LLPTTRPRESSASRSKVGTRSKNAELLVHRIRRQGFATPRVRRSRRHFLFTRACVALFGALIDRQGTLHKRHMRADHSGIAHAATDTLPPRPSSRLKGTVHRSCRMHVSISPCSRDSARATPHRSAIRSPFPGIKLITMLIQPNLMHLSQVFRSTLVQRKTSPSLTKQRYLPVTFVPRCPVRLGSTNV
jgi:hypothetical protein